MKRICFILSDSNTKGSNGAFIELIDSLNRNKLKLYVLLPSNGPMVHELEIRNIPLKVLYYKWWMREQGSPKWKKLRTLVRPWRGLGLREFFNTVMHEVLFTLRGQKPRPSTYSLNLTVQSRKG